MWLAVGVDTIFAGRVRYAIGRTMGRVWRVALALCIAAVPWLEGYGEVHRSSGLTAGPVAIRHGREPSDATPRWYR